MPELGYFLWIGFLPHNLLLCRVNLRALIGDEGVALAQTFRLGPNLWRS